MKQKILLVLISIILISCGVDHKDFSGDWLDKKNESDRMIIKKNGDNYIVENRGKKYPAQINDDLLEISTELPIKATIDENDNLILLGNEYIRYKYAIKPKFIGVWLESHSENSNSKIDLDVEPGRITITEQNGEFKAEYNGNAYVRKEYLNLKYSNKTIKYDLRHYDEIGYSKLKRDMEFRLIDDRKIETLNHNDESFNYILIKE